MSSIHDGTAPWEGHGEGQPVQANKQNEAEEQAYALGARFAWVSMLNRCIQELGYTDVDSLGWIAEREAAIAALRELCAEHGDNDWNNDLHMADIITKHLGDYL